jgi:hypothetical protein
MSFTNSAFAAVWVSVLLAVALSTAGLLADKALFLILGALAPAIVLVLTAGWWLRPVAARPFDRTAIAAADRGDLMRMDSDKG